MDNHWTRVFSAAGLPEPRIGYNWIAPGSVTLTGCGPPADDMVALYCPADDTVYIGQQFAADLYAGVLRNLPGERAGFGHAAGDFAVSYAVGDFDVGNQQHHGTPEERREALLAGFDSGDPSICREYLPLT